jgi:hypothetical protein
MAVKRIYPRQHYFRVVFWAWRVTFSDEMPFEKWRLNVGIGAMNERVVYKQTFTKRLTSVRHVRDVKYEFEMAERKGKYPEIATIFIHVPEATLDVQLGWVLCSGTSPYWRPDACSRQTRS